AIITGYPGTGKSALIYEFARQLAAGGETIPAHLREFDIFELSPAFLRAGASLAGEYDQRVKTLLEILKRNPKIILFVDEIHSLLRSGMHEKGPFSEANETIKSALSRGEIICIGCTTTAEFRHYIQPDAALMRRFVEIPLRPPSAEAATRILRARLPRLEKHYAPFRVPDAMLASVVALTDQYLPARQQPDKSIQILDRACARSVTAKPRRSELGEADLLRAIEDVVGYPLLRGSSLTEESVYTALAAKIVGQDETLHAIARAFVAGLGGWMKKTCPRAVLLFSGPTGVGKTETAVALGAILGRGRAGLIRIDCNTLAGSGLDSGPALNRLLGAPPGYIGYSRGQGGLLSRVRDEPESVVLFDEIEKADPGVGKLLLQILDSGRVDDAEGNTLDFRRSFLVFTTNAGCVYESRRLGFGETGGGPNPVPLVDQEKLQRDFHAAGFGPEFLARIGHIFEFRSLDASGIRTIIQSHLKGLLELAGARGFAFEWDARVEELLASEWQSRFGVRHLKTILTNRITEQLSVAEAQGELRGVTRIRLRVLALDGNAANLDFTGAATHERAEENLIIKLA
ncbi:MAG: AAA family ATPase, partial [Acidobacteria bacterium]|nr:AAA family ATPase [Acidobacteriota bacterium]